MYRNTILAGLQVCSALIPKKCHFREKEFPRCEKEK